MSKATFPGTLAGLALSLLAVSLSGPDARAAETPIPVDVHNFARAETDMYFSGFAKEGAFGKFRHSRTPASIDDQSVVRMNRDTLYSRAVFDVEAAPVTITLPDPGKRYMSMLVVSEDHYAIDVVYGPGNFTYDRDKVGTRYVFFLVRTLANPEDPEDIAAANRLQDGIVVQQANTGTFDAPQWDQVSQTRARDALSVLGSLGGTVDRFGTKDQVDPIDHLIGTAIGWGGNPRSAADYVSFYPPDNDGETVYSLTVKDVPVDGFWSVSVYNGKGFFEKNDLDAYSLNNLTAKPDADGSVTVRFGGCDGKIANCLPIVKGWNYTVRLYRPRAEILDGSWTFPEAKPVR